MEMKAAKDPEQDRTDLTLYLCISIPAGYMSWPTWLECDEGVP